MTESWIRIWKWFFSESCMKSAEPILLAPMKLFEQWAMGSDCMSTPVNWRLLPHLDLLIPNMLANTLQIIMLLSNLGVDDDVFLHLLKTNLAHLSEMFVHEKVARGKITSITCIDWRKLEESGVLITTEPYLRSLMIAFYRYGHWWQSMAHVTLRASWNMIKLAKAINRSM